MRLLGAVASGLCLSTLSLTSIVVGGLNKRGSCSDPNFVPCSSTGGSSTGGSSGGGGSTGGSSSGGGSTGGSSGGGGSTGGSSSGGGSTGGSSSGGGSTGGSSGGGGSTDGSSSGGGSDLTGITSDLATLGSHDALGLIGRNYEKRQDALCCAQGLKCLVSSSNNFPYCYDPVSTEYVFSDGSYGIDATGDFYDSSSGIHVNLLSGDYTLANGTTGNYYTDHNTTPPNTSTLSLPKASGTATIAPSSIAEVQATHTGTTAVVASTTPAATGITTQPKQSGATVSVVGHILLACTGLAGIAGFISLVM